MSTPQTPIGSGFDASSTAADVMAGIDLSCRTALVTGGYSGIGLITAQALAAAGARVIVPARDRAKAEVALAGTPQVEIGAADLQNAASIRRFASSVLETTPQLDILINSAGIMAAPLARDGDGHESQFATNHLGHFRLATALLPALKAAPGARVVAVSSRGHHFAGVDFDDIDFQRRDYDKWLAYGQSKTANALFALELDRRFQSEGIRAFSLHPGQILTDLARHLSREEVDAFDPWDGEGRQRIDPENGWKSPEQGAATSLWCATAPLLAGHGGVYCENCDIAVTWDGNRENQRGVASWATDPAAAERLWDTSQRWSA